MDGLKVMAGQRFKHARHFIHGVPSVLVSSTANLWIIRKMKKIQVSPSTFPQSSQHPEGMVNVEGKFNLVGFQFKEKMILKPETPIIPGAAELLL